MKVIEYIKEVGAILSAVEKITPAIKRLIEDATVVLGTGEPTAEQWDALHQAQTANTIALDALMEGE